MIQSSVEQRTEDRPQTSANHLPWASLFLAGTALLSTACRSAPPPAQENDMWDQFAESLLTDGLSSMGDLFGAVTVVELNDVPSVNGKALEIRFGFNQPGKYSIAVASAHGRRIEAPLVTVSAEQLDSIGEGIHYQSIQFADLCAAQLSSIEITSRHLEDDGWSMIRTVNIGHGEMELGNSGD